MMYPLVGDLAAEGIAVTVSLGRCPASSSAGIPGDGVSRLARESGVEAGLG